MGDNRLEQMKKRQITFIGDNPLQIVEDTEPGLPGLSVEQQDIVNKVGETISAYLKASEELFREKYAHIKEESPIHLTNPGNVLVACCQDGVIIRYERKVDERKLWVGWLSGSLSTLASTLSQGLVQCYPDNNYVSTVSTTGTEIKLSILTPSTNTSSDLASIKVGCDIVISRPARLPSPPQKPFRLLSIRNTFELHIMGNLLTVRSFLRRFSRNGAKPCIQR